MIIPVNFADPFGCLRLKTHFLVSWVWKFTMIYDEIYDDLRGGNEVL